MKLGLVERQDRILRALRVNAAVQVGALATALGVTTETIRRDLARLRDSGQLQRTYGGATLPPTGVEPRVTERAARRIEERRIIARIAASLVAADDVLLIDAGSTTAMFARALAEVPGLTVITNGFDVATAVAEGSGARIIMCPGDYTPREGGVTGAETIAFLERFRATKVFLSASGLTEAGPMEADSGAASVKRAMLRAADRRILLADSGKFGRTALELVCRWSLIDDVVSDAPPSGALAAAIGTVRVHAIAVANAA